MVKQTIQEGGDGRSVAEQFPPVVHGTVRRDERRRALIPAHDDLQQILRGGLGQFPHAEVVDDEQRNGGDVCDVGLAGPLELGVGELVEEDVGLAVEDAMALLNDGEADRLGEVALAGAGSAEEEPRSVRKLIPSWGSGRAVVVP